MTAAHRSDSFAKIAVVLMCAVSMPRSSQAAGARALRVLLSNPNRRPEGPGYRPLDCRPGYTSPMRRVCWLVLVLQLPLSAQTAPARHVDRAQLMRDLTILASPDFEGRRTGTPGSLKARGWIAQQFRAAGLTPAGTEDYLHPFTFSTSDRSALLPGGRPFRTVYTAANVLGRLDGREPGARMLVITAHYDHLGIRDSVLYPGADDNASGVAAALAAARHFKANP